MLQAWRWMSAVLLRVFEPEVRAWYGLEPLWKVFWGYGVLASAVIIALYAVATIERRAAMQQLLLMFFAGYTIWILVSVWRCAATSMPIWQTLARSLTVAWAVNAVLVIFFGFIFVTVSSRLTGEIGSSSNPISGMTVATLLFTCVVFVILGRHVDQLADAIFARARAHSSLPRSSARSAR